MKTRDNKFKFWLSFLVLTAAILITMQSLGWRGVTYAQSYEPHLTRATDAQNGPDLPTQVVELDEPQWRINVPLKTLASESNLIAIGRPILNRYRQSPDGQVMTVYQVRLQEIITGNRTAGTTIVVTMPGGLVRERNGGWLRVRTRRLRKMENGKLYVLFLKDGGREPRVMTTVRGSQGIYELPRGGSRVIHYGRSLERPGADDGEEISSFLQTIRGFRRNR